MTQVLFLLNPYDFLPIDDQATSLGFFDSIPKPISWEEYVRRIDLVRKGLPGCWPYEANLLSYLISSGSVSSHQDNVFQVSTNVGNDGTDNWDDFESNNYVYTGWEGQERKYPLDKPKRGDVILVRFGRTEGRGIGVVYENDYRNGFDESHRLHVLWLNKRHAKLSAATPLLGFSYAKGKTLEAFRHTEEYSPTFELLGRLGNGEEPEGAPSPTDSREEDGPPLNRIPYGPPGTGKTWRTAALTLAIVDRTDESPVPDRERIRKTFDDNAFDPNNRTGNIATVTFHQSFAYEDFIEGIRPVLKGDSLAYEMRDGIFKSITEAARNRSSERFILIIDEINRGNVAKIFGELITLIENSKRIGGDDETWVILPYSGEWFGVPDNLYIIGTMNTADRSIQLLDTALRRRFTFLEMMPNPEHEDICRDIDGVDCTMMLRTMNERIAALLDREHQIGHTYLLGVNEMDKLSETFRSRIFPLLQEYFFDDRAKIRAILGHNAFVRDRKVQSLFRESDSTDDREVIFERLPNDDPGWWEPGEYRKIYGGEGAAEPEGT